MSASEISQHLLESKFQPQLGARSMLSRARLALPLKFTQGGITLVAVVAATGFGKSTLMAQWFAQAQALVGQPLQCAWLNLDENDNDPTRLLRYLFGALEKAIPAISGLRLHDVASSSSPAVLLEELSIRLQAQTATVLLFIDDLHLIVAPAAVQVLEWLVRQTGPKLRFVLGSRQSLGIRIPDLRLRGQLLEINQRTLAFNAEEAQQFCAARLAQPLDSAAFATLLQKTEGWPAAMELLTLALQDAPDAMRLIADFASSERAILEYLGDVVFGRTPHTQRVQIHQLAQFDRICAELAGVICEHPAPDSMLADLQRRHLFLEPLDRHGSWFRFHHLAGDYLRRHAPDQGCNIVATLNAGGKWYFEHQMFDDAIDCVVRAKNWELTCEWMLKSAEDVAQRQGQVVNFIRWIPLIPRKYLDAHPQIQFHYWYALSFQQNQSAVERGLNTLEASLSQPPQGASKRDPAMVDQLRCSIAVQRMVSRALGDEVSNLLPQVEAWLQAWPHASARTTGGALNLAAFACKSNGEIDKGLDFCARGRQINLADQGYFAASFNLLISGLLLLKRGAYRDAAAVAHEGLQFLTERLYDHVEHVSYFQTLLAAVHYEFDALESATLSMDACLGSLDETGVCDFVLLKYLGIARLQFHAGQADAGLQALRLGRKIGQRRHLPRLSISLAGEECIWLCRLGHVPAALELARQHGFDRALYASYDMVSDKAARVGPRLLLNDRPDMAAAQLRPALERATAMNLHHRRVEFLVLYAAALLRCGQTGEALDAWQTALDLSQRFGYRRVLLDDSALIAPLLAAAQRKAMPAAPAWLHGLAQKPTAGTEEALTKMELRILKQLDSSASNLEIAAAFFISRGTLKWHLHNIYRKLACRNRSGALLAARQRGLV